MLSVENSSHSLGEVLCFKVTQKTHPFFRGGILLPDTWASCAPRHHTWISCVVVMCWLTNGTQGLGVGSRGLQYLLPLRKVFKLPTLNTELERNVTLGCVSLLLGTSVWYFTVTSSRWQKTCISPMTMTGWIHVPLVCTKVSNKGESSGLSFHYWPHSQQEETQSIDLTGLKPKTHLNWLKRLNGRVNLKLHAHLNYPHIPNPSIGPYWPTWQISLLCLDIKTLHMWLYCSNCCLSLATWLALVHGTLVTRM